MDPAKPSTCEQPSTETLTELSREFIQHCRIAKALSKHTLRAYATDLANFTNQVGRDATAMMVEASHITTYIDAMRCGRKLKDTTIRRRIAVLKVFFTWLERNGAVFVTPFRGLELLIRPPKRLPRALSANDMGRLLRASEKRMSNGYEGMLTHTIVVTLFATGMRVGELVAIRLGDLSLLDMSVLVHGKGNRERRVYVTGRGSATALRRYLKQRRRRAGESDHLFLTGHGAQMSCQCVRAKLLSLANRAGVQSRVTPHMLRHTAATQLVDAGVDIRFVQKLLGHSSIATTQIYTHVTDAMLKAKLQGADTLRRVRRAG